MSIVSNSPSSQDEHHCNHYKHFIICNVISPDSGASSPSSSLPPSTSSTNTSSYFICCCCKSQCISTKHIICSMISHEWLVVVHFFSDVLSVAWISHRPGHTLLWQTFEARRTTRSITWDVFAQTSTIHVDVCCDILLFISLHFFLTPLLSSLSDH